MVPSGMARILTVSPAPPAATNCLARWPPWGRRPRDERLAPLTAVHRALPHVSVVARVFAVSARKGRGQPASRKGAIHVTGGKQAHRPPLVHRAFRQALPSRP